MTQPYISDNSRFNTPTGSKQGKLSEDSMESFNLPSSEQPAIVHPNFDPKRTPLDPARPLSDIPEPARCANAQLQRLYATASLFKPPKQSLSKWQLIASKPFSEHLDFLTVAKLIELPSSFYQCYKNSQDSSTTQAGAVKTNTDASLLLASLASMTLLDMADIQSAITHFPKLTRYGFSVADQSSSALPKNKPYDSDELLNSLYAEDWQVILQPQDFETGLGSLATDIMACSVAVHALKQCATRKTINQSYSAEQICHYVRSYLLSQIYLLPAHRYHYRQIRLFSGHIIVAAHHLGWDVQVANDGQAYFNLSSRCGLLTRYANMTDYYINGWIG